VGAQALHGTISLGECFGMKGIIMDGGDVVLIIACVAMFLAGMATFWFFPAFAGGVGIGWVAAFVAYPYIMGER
jgi:hypothetical protein